MATKKDTQQPQKEAKPSEAPVPEKVDVSLEDYLKEVVVNAGLVASFRVEASKLKDGLKERPKEEWAHALDAQSKRIYV